MKHTRKFKIIIVESFEVVKKLRVKRSEMEMERHDIEEVEIEEDHQIFDPENRRFVKREADQPKRSPIRRKDKWRQVEGIKTKVKKNHKKIQHRLKYDWQGE